MLIELVLMATSRIIQNQILVQSNGDVSTSEAESVTSVRRGEKAIKENKESVPILPKN